MTRLLRSLVLLVLLATATTAAADEFYNTYQHALATFKQKNYAAARSEFLIAYDLRAEPIILFNVAQTYRLEGNSEQALVFYKRFLAESKIAEDLRAEAQRHVAVIEADLATRAAADARTAPKEADGTPVRIGPPLQTRTAAAPPTTAASVTAPSTTAPIDRGPSDRRLVPLGSKIALGVGAVGLGSAIVLGVLGLRAEHDLKEDPAADQSDADRVERYQNAINVSWAVTGVAAATAVTLYFVTPSPARDRRSIGVAPMHGGGWAASLGGRF